MLPQVMPSQEFSAQQAVEVQLAALQRNDDPWCVWHVHAFDHPWCVWHVHAFDHPWCVWHVHAFDHPCPTPLAALNMPLVAAANASMPSQLPGQGCC